MSGKKVKDNEQLLTFRRDIKFLGTNQNSEITGSNYSGHYYNYYLSNNPEGITGVKSFKEVNISEIYNGIDLKIYDNGKGELEYDFIVKPGADPDQIRIQITEDDNSNILDGNLISRSKIFDIENTKPVAFQNNKPVEARFNLNGNEISFDLAVYDPSFSLTIDPIARVWGTYFAGTCPPDPDDPAVNTQIVASDIDDRGDLVVVGFSKCDLNIASTGAFQEDLNGDLDVVVKKLDAVGNSLWTTFYGGLAIEYADDIAIDGQNAIAVIGRTDSPDVIASAGASQQTKNGPGGDYFIVKFNPQGGRDWGTYFGGSSSELFEDRKHAGIVFDSDDDILITGKTNSTDLSTPGAWQENLAGSIDAFLAKFDRNGTREWVTYLGGSGEERFTGPIAVLSNDDIIVGGATLSSSGIATIGAFQGNFEGTGQNSMGFLSRFDENGERIWGTYFGGPNEDVIKDFKIDNNDDIILSGESFNEGLEFGQFSDEKFDSGLNIITAKFDSDGNRIWATYFGCDGNSRPNAISLDEDQNPIIIGITNCELPADGFETEYQGQNDVFFVKYSNQGERYWSTHFGAARNDFGSDIVVDNDDIYAVGWTSSNQNISLNGEQNDRPNPQDQDATGFIVKHNDVSVNVESLTPPNPCLGEDFQIFYTLGQNLNYTFNFKAELSDEDGNFDNPTELGNNLSSTSGIIVAKLPDDIVPSSNYKIRIRGTSEVFDLVIGEIPEASILLPSENCGFGEYEIIVEDPDPEIQYFWTIEYDGEIFEEDDEESIEINIIDDGSNTDMDLFEVFLEAVDPLSGCESITSQTFAIYYPYSYSYDPIVCLNEEIEIEAFEENENRSYWWYLDGEFIDNDGEYDFAYTFNESGTYQITVFEADLRSSCTFENNFMIEVQEEGDFSGDLFICELGEYNYQATKTGNNYTYFWSPTNGVITGRNDEPTVDVEWQSGENKTLTLQQVDTETGCNWSISKTISEISTDNVEIFGNSLICSGNLSHTYSTNITNANSYTWSAINGSVTVLGNNLAQVDWQESDPKTLYVDIDFNGICSSSDELTVLVDDEQLAAPEIDGSETVCSGQLFTYSIEDLGYSNIIWSVTDGQIQGDNNIETVEVIWEDESNGEISVEIENELSCTSQATKLVTIENVLADIDGEENICLGQDYTYSTSIISNSSISWSVVNGVINGPDDQSTANVSWGTQDPKSITLNKRLINGCSSQNSLEIVEDDSNEFSVNSGTFYFDPKVDTELQSFPIYIESLPCGLEFGTGTTNLIEAELIVDNSILLPITNSSQTFTYDLENKIVNIRNIVDQINPEDPVLILEAYLLIGNKISTDIYLNSLSINGESLVYLNTIGQINLENIPNDSGFRLVNNESIINMNISPNPNTGSFNISLESSKDQTITFEIISSLGSVMFNSKNELKTGNNYLKFELNDLNNGAYSIIIKTDNNEIHTKNMIIIK